MADGSVEITLGGNATVLIGSGSFSLVTDPWLSAAIGPWKRWRPAALTPADVSAADAVLISHAHPDHLDPVTLAVLDADTPVFSPEGAPRRRLQRLGLREVRAVREWETVSLGAARIHAVPSIHTRWCLGFVVELSGLRVYFAGDSGPATPFAEIGRRCGPLDVALLPVGGSTLAPGPLQRHLTPELAARAAADLSPRVVIPMHWGHVACVPAMLDYFRGTAERFRALMAQLAPEIEVRLPADGETISVFRAQE